MYVCSCKSVTDRTIDAAIASGATTVEEIASTCLAGARCGGCWPALERMLANGRSDDHRGPAVAPTQRIAA